MPLIHNIASKACLPTEMSFSIKLCVHCFVIKQRLLPGVQSLCLQPCVPAFGTMFHANTQVYTLFEIVKKLFYSLFLLITYSSIDFSQTTPG